MVSAILIHSISAGFREAIIVFSFVYLLQVDYIEWIVGKDSGDTNLTCSILETNSIAIAGFLVVLVTAAGVVGAIGNVPRCVELCMCNTEQHKDEHQVNHHSRRGRGDLRIMLLICLCVLRLYTYTAAIALTLAKFDRHGYPMIANIDDRRTR